MKRLLIIVITALGLGISAVTQATTITYTAVLDGASESPPNGSLGSGLATAYFDDVGNTLLLNVTFSGLSGGTTAANIHCCTALAGVGAIGVATTVPRFAGFPTDVVSGSYNASLDLMNAGSYNPAYITANGGIDGARLALMAGMNAGQAYFNIHSRAFPGGEIRGFFNQVPEPGTLALFAVGAACLVARRRRGPLSSAE